MLALTATADRATRADIVERLFPAQPTTFVHSFDRPNISLRFEVKHQVRRQLAAFLDQHRGASGIVYCSSRERTHVLADYLGELGHDTVTYHAGLDQAVRHKNGDRFLQEDGVVAVATIAFGMGINKPDIRFVAHADMPSSVEVVEGKPRDLGGFSVRRVLPSLPHRSVGPFVFFDQLGPAVLPVGEGVQVRPHPHIGLATVTFLFEGEMIHRDSLGSVQAIRPGDVNWMTAGRGIVHSERSPDAIRERTQPIHAIQSWVALPKTHEDVDPSFAHHPGSTLPTIDLPGVRITVIAGEAFGRRSPVDVLVPTLYAVASMDAGSTLVVDDAHEERAVFVVEGDVSLDGEPVRAQTMAVLTSRGDAIVAAAAASRVMLVGGARLDGPRALEWNFVASDRRRIDEARDEWARFPTTRFPQVPGESEFIPLPPRPRPEPTSL